MSINPVSSNQQQQFQQVRDNYQTLSQALQSGNLTAAQNAYGAIQQEQQNGGPQPPANSPLATAFSALGQALQSGDLSGAQQAFSSLQSDLQSLRKSGGHHGAHGAGGAKDADDQDSSDPSASTDNSQKTVASEITTTNANGTLTVTTTYTDGTTSATTEPNPTPAVSKSPLDGANSGQLSVLLNAQESAQNEAAA